MEETKKLTSFLPARRNISDSIKNLRCENINSTIDEITHLQDNNYVRQDHTYVSHSLLLPDRGTNIPAHSKQIDHHMIELTISTEGSKESTIQ